MRDLKEAIKEALQKIKSTTLKEKDLSELILILEDYTNQFDPLKKEILLDSLEWIKILQFILEKYETGNFNINGEDWKTKNLDFIKLKKIIGELEYTAIEQVIWSLGGNCFFKLVDKREFINFIYSKLKEVLTKNFVDIGYDEEISIKEIVKIEDLSPEEKELLTKIYIGEAINEGIIIECKGVKYLKENEEGNLDSLIKKGLVRKINPYSSVKTLITAITIISGTELSQKIINSKLEGEGEKLLEEIKIIPNKILGFLLDNEEESNIFQISTEENYFVESKEDLLFRNKKIQEYIKTFCEILIKRGFAVSTNNYVSSKGGRVDNEEYVLCPEVRNYIILKLNLSSLNRAEAQRLTLIYTLYYIKEDILDVEEDKERKRNDFWELLKGLPFDESVLKEKFSSFEKEKIITEYTNIQEENFLFKILDEEKYNQKIRDILDYFIDSLIHPDLSSHSEILKDKTTFKLHSELFLIIGEFETAIRNLLIQEITSHNNKKVDWEQFLGGSELIKKLKQRKNDDEKLGMIPEKELIYYADILDYKEIIINNWELFGNHFRETGITKEIVEAGLTEINKIRRKVMHLREIKDWESDTLKLFIIPKLQEAF